MLVWGGFGAGLERVRAGMGFAEGSLRVESLVT